MREVPSLARVRVNGARVSGPSVTRLSGSRGPASTPGTQPAMVPEAAEQAAEAVAEAVEEETIDAGDAKPVAPIAGTRVHWLALAAVAGAAVLTKLVLPLLLGRRQQRGGQGKSSPDGGCAERSESNAAQAKTKGNALYAQVSS